MEIGNGNKIKNSQIISGDGKLILNGKEIPNPPGNRNNITMVDGKVYIDGYEFKDKTWQRTLMALYHKYF